MKVLLWIVGIVFAGSLVLLIAGMNMSPRESAAYDQRERVNAACEQMMSDAALGSERRHTRDICDRMKAAAQAELEAARRAPREPSARYETVQWPSPDQALKNIPATTPTAPAPRASQPKRTSRAASAAH